jgi:hypothetical protein
MSVHTLLPGIPIIESPLFETIVAEGAIPAELVPVARALHTHGFAVIDFPDPDIDARIDRIKADLVPRFAIDLADAGAIKTRGDNRLQDAWTFNHDVATIAANAQICAMLSLLWGRRAFPFQTLNFPVGTQQAPHADAVHFSSMPERFMCGVWLAMEDIRHEAGPLVYYPGSHRWPCLTNLLIGRAGDFGGEASAQTPFEPVWQAMVQAQQIAPETFLARKGQALIWTANLLHGGSPQIDPRLTRWSQVTHYYFDDCIYYTPAFSHEPVGQLDLRTITDVTDGTIVANRHLGRAIATPAKAARRGIFDRVLGRKPPLADPALPPDFDEQRYLALHADVAANAMSAREHYLRFGRAEGRRYR